VKKNRAAIDESLRVAKTKVAVIEVVGDPPGGEVLVNGNVVGQLPLSGPVRIESGEIEVELRAPGHRRASKSLRVDGGQYQRIVVRAEPEAATPAAAAPIPAAAATPAASNPPNVSVYLAQPPTGGAVTTHPAEPVSGWRRAPKWVSWGLGGASLGVGIYGLARHLARLDEFDNSCAFDVDGVVYATPGSTLDMKSCEGLRDDYRSARRLAIIGSVGAGALAITGFIFYITEPKSGDGRTALACAPDVGLLNRLSFGCSLRF
jgi:hypothetical protein